MHNIPEALQRNVEAQRSRHEKKGRGGGEGDGAIATATMERKSSQEQRRVEAKARATEEEERGGEGMRSDNREARAVCDGAAGGCSCDCTPRLCVSSTAQEFLTAYKRWNSAFELDGWLAAVAQPAFLSLRAAHLQLTAHWSFCSSRYLLQRASDDGVGLAEEMGEASGNSKSGPANKAEGIHCLGKEEEETKPLFFGTFNSDADLAAKSSRPQTAGPFTWPTRRSWTTGRTKDARCRTADLAQVRSAPPHLQAHASPPVRQAWREARRHGKGCGSMEPAADPNRTTSSSPGLRHSSIRTPEPTPESPLSGPAPLYAEEIAKRAV
ncbi:hypothetical protein GW17_00058864 [Ensete ventricosum]|nr:hypothetical protein GW17_00058864 [Ensete ventricosum]